MVALEKWFSAAFFQQSPQDSADGHASCAHCVQSVGRAGKHPIVQWLAEITVPLAKRAYNHGTTGTPEIVIDGEAYIGPCRDMSTDYINSKLFSDVPGRAISGCTSQSLCSTCLTEIDSIWASAWNALKIRGGTACTGVSADKLFRITICTWNAAGLFCDNPIKYSNKLRFVDLLLSRSTVCAVQETHDDGDAACCLLSQIHRREFKLFRSSMSAAAGGVLLAIRVSYVDLFYHVAEFVIWAGRIFAVALHHRDLTVAFITVHVHSMERSERGKIEMLQALLNFVNGHRSWHIFICGDFNFVTAQADRLDLQSGCCSGRICGAAHFWLDNFSHFDELYQGSHTRYPSLSSNEGSTARLDRIYGNTSLEAFALMDIRTSTVGTTPDRDLSDHLPVISAIQIKTKEASTPCIPHFVVKTPFFQGRANELINKFSFDDCCWARLIQTKELLQAAYRDYLVHVKRCGATLPKERIFWCLQALRASFTHDRGLFEEALSVLPAIRHDSFKGGFPIAATHLGIIRAELQQSLQIDDDETARDLESTQSIPEHERKTRTAGLAKKLSMHNPWRRKLGIEAVRDNTGMPIHDKDEASDYLARHWGKQFQEKVIDEEAARRFVSQFALKMQSFVMIESFGRFMAMIRDSKRSAPGPDGIPYLAWNVSLRAQVFLFQACMFWLATGYCPTFFNIAFLWLLPKSHPEDGVFDPKDTRPLSGANSDAKLFARFIAMSLEEAISKWAFWMQRGFIQGRCMLKNVIDIETRSAKLAFNPDSFPCLIFFDFAAAFPSISRAFIWLVFDFIGLPVGVVRAIQALYRNNIHFIKGAFGLRFAFYARAGVRQGCPLSSLVFIIATDCIMRALAASLGPRDMLRAYADDIAVAARCFTEICWRLAPLFRCIQSCSQLTLNMKKCVAIPLWPVSDVQDLITWLKTNLPDWADISISDHGKYLGFFIGPGSIDKEWAKVMRKMLEASSFIKACGRPKLQSFIMFQMFGYSQLQFVAQLRNPCKRMRQTEIQTVRDLIGGPGLWAPLGTFFHMRSNNMFPKDLKSVDTLCLSTMLRTALQTVDAWQSVAHELDLAARNDDELHQFPYPDWWEHLAVVNFNKALRKLNRCDFAELRDYDSGKGRPCVSLQSALYKFLLPRMHPFVLKDALRAKFARWFDHTEVDVVTSHAITVLDRIYRIVPPCVLFSLLSTWCNAWCTPHRFQGPDGQCFLCSDCTGADVLEHYAVCKYHWRASAKRLRMNPEPRSLLRFLGLDPNHLHEADLQACHVYAVKRAADTRRRAQIRHPASMLDKLVWEGHKTVAAFSPAMCKRYRSLWT